MKEEHEKIGYNWVLFFWVYECHFGTRNSTSLGVFCSLLILVCQSHDGCGPSSFDSFCTWCWVHQASWSNETICDSWRQSQRSRQLCHLCTRQKEGHDEIPQLVFIRNLLIVPRPSAGNSLSFWEWNLQSVDLVPNTDLGARCQRQILTS